MCVKGNFNTLTLLAVMEDGGEEMTKDHSTFKTSKIKVSAYPGRGKGNGKEKLRVTANTERTKHIKSIPLQSRANQLKINGIFKFMSTDH